MKTSSNGRDLIKMFEGFREMPKWDVKGYSVGYGHLIKKGEEHLNKGVTKAQAEQLLAKDLDWAEKAVSKGLKVDVTQNQFDALVSWVYNLGPGKAYGENQSDLFKMINAKAPKTKIVDFWTTHYITAKGKPLPGLRDRRAKEAHYFVTGLLPDSHEVISWADTGYESNEPVAENPIVQVASRYIGTAEKPGKENNPEIMAWAKAIGAENYPSDETAWCALFVNFIAFQCGYDGTFRHNSLSPLLARHWLQVGQEVKEPQPGDILISTRGKDGKQGHVAIVVERLKGKCIVISGNWGGKVAKHEYSDYAPDHNLLGFRRLKQVGKPMVKIETPTTGEKKKGNSLLMVGAALLAKSILFG